MPDEMVGRRVQSNGQHPAGVLKQPGDYCGPVTGFTGEALAVYYLLPTARDPDAPGEARRIHHVVSPPHVLREEQDGTLTIRESIGAGVWHGFLNAGKWELTKRPTPTGD